MNKQKHVSDNSFGSPARLPGAELPPLGPQAPEITAALGNQEVWQERAREAIEYHSHPEKMNLAQLLDIDDL